MTQQTNDQAAEVIPAIDDAAASAEALREKLTDAQTPGYQAEFDPEEAERAGAFVEDALSEEDAADSNADLAAEAGMGDTQVARFLVLHKELDPDDDELTRTRKVRRGFIAQKYAVLVDALYGGRTEQFIETQVKFEDGRTGSVSATLKILDAKVHAPAKVSA